MACACIPQASEIRDGLSKALYERIFQQIVDRLNDALDQEAETEGHAWIGYMYVCEPTACLNEPEGCSRSDSNRV